MCELLAPRTSRRYMETHFKERRTIRMIGVLAIAQLSSFIGWFPYDHLDLSSGPKKSTWTKRCRRCADNNIRLEQNMGSAPSFMLYFGLIPWDPLNLFSMAAPIPLLGAWSELTRHVSGTCARLFVHFFVVTARLRHDISRFMEDFLFLYMDMDLKNSTPIK